MKIKKEEIVNFNFDFSGYYMHPDGMAFVLSNPHISNYSDTFEKREYECAYALSIGTKGKIKTPTWYVEDILIEHIKEGKVVPITREDFIKRIETESENAVTEELKIKVKKEELQIGDIIHYVHKGYDMFCKVEEKINAPLMKFPDNKIIYPVMVDGYFPENGNRFGRFKLSDDETEYELVYRENPTPLVPFEEIMNNKTNEDEQ